MKLIPFGVQQVSLISLEKSVTNNQSYYSDKKGYIHISVKLVTKEGCLLEYAYCKRFMTNLGIPIAG